jgi:Cu/Ag efflux pump CusA
VLLATAFIVFAGVYAVRHTALDAIPDLSDTQVIVYTEYPGQAPQVIEDQVTYPLTTALLAVPRSKVVRGFSFFGVSFVYVVFEDGTDLYWARSRVLEYLNFAAKRLPEGITPSLGPDATGVGWVYQYVVLGAQRTLAELRTIQDWYLRYQLTKAEGVAEVASVGGFVQQYQVVVDPQKLQAYGLTLAQLTSAIRASNRDVCAGPRSASTIGLAVICSINMPMKRRGARTTAGSRTARTGTRSSVLRRRPGRVQFGPATGTGAQHDRLSGSRRRRPYREAARSRWHH